jgi:FkbM family methyltransferase
VTSFSFEERAAHRVLNDNPMKIPLIRLNLVETCIIAIGVGVIVFFAGSYHAAEQLRPFLSRGGAELQPLRQRFGAERNSRYGEEWLIRDYFNDQRGGIFVDVGANHYQRDSNTYYLEERLGWSGVAIEPQTKFGADYAKHRPRTVFVPLFASDRSDIHATLYVPTNDLVASSDKSFVQREVGDAGAPVEVYTATLDDILYRHKIARIDFLSVDVELHEPEVLNGFSISRFRPRLVCIESHAPVRQKILDYFASHGYGIVGKYLRLDSENLWFAPATVN